MHDESFEGPSDQSFYNPNEPLIVNLQNYLHTSKKYLVNSSSNEKVTSRIFNGLNLFFGEHIDKAYPIGKDEYDELKVLLNTLPTRVLNYIEKTSNFILYGDASSDDLGSLDASGEMCKWYRKLKKKFDIFFYKIDASSNKTYLQLLTDTILQENNNNSKILDLDLIEDFYIADCIQFLTVKIENENSKENEFIKNYEDKNKIKHYSADFFQYVIKGDGNCLFRAIAHQLKRIKYKPNYSHKQLRKLAVNCIDQNRFDFVDSIEGRVTKYLEKMSKNRAWGGEQEIAALASGLKLCILVYKQGDKNPIIYGAENHSKIYIAYHKKHYNSLIPIESSLISVKYMTSISDLLIGYFKKYPSYVYEFFDKFYDNYKLPNFPHDDFKSKAEIFNDFLVFLHKENKYDEINVLQLFFDIYKNNFTYKFIALSHDHGNLLNQLINTLIFAFIDRLYLNNRVDYLGFLKSNKKLDKELMQNMADIKKLLSMSRFHFARVNSDFEKKNKEYRKFLLEELSEAYEKTKKECSDNNDKESLPLLEKALYKSLTYIYQFTLVNRPHSSSEYNELTSALKNCLIMAYDTQPLLSDSKNRPSAARQSKIDKIIDTMCNIFFKIVTKLLTLFHCGPQKTEVNNAGKTGNATSVVPATGPQEPSVHSVEYLDQENESSLETDSQFFSDNDSYNYSRNSIVRESSNDSDISVYYDALEEPQTRESPKLR